MASSKKVFILHGWTYSLDAWTECVKELKKLGFDPQQLKVPGLTEPSDQVWTVEKYVDWLDSIIKKEKNPIVIGHSNGGRIAMAYDATHPGKIDQLVLLASAGVPRDDTSSLSLKKRIAKLVGVVVKPFTTPTMRRKLSRLIGSSDYGSAAPNMRQTMHKLWEYDHNSFDASKVTAKTSLIWGSEDVVTPLSLAEHIEANAPNIKGLHVALEAGHTLHFQKPKEVAGLIAKSLQ